MRKILMFFLMCSLGLGLLHAETKIVEKITYIDYKEKAFIVRWFKERLIISTLGRIEYTGTECSQGTYQKGINLKELRKGDIVEITFSDNPKIIEFINKQDFMKNEERLIPLKINLRCDLN